MGPFNVKDASDFMMCAREMKNDLAGEVTDAMDSAITVAGTWRSMEASEGA